MIENFKEYVSSSYTAFHAVKNAEKKLLENGFVRLYEKDGWEISEGGKYYVIRGGSALAAFTVGNGGYFKIAASHTDSPALKIKENPLIKENGYIKLNVEKYGGGILYSFLDRPLKIAGRIVYEADGKLSVENVVSDYSIIIPSLAIHMNRGVNDSFSINAQTDMCPIFDLAESDKPTELYATLTDKNVIGADLYLVNADGCTDLGASKKLLSAPRVDNLTSVFASVNALIDAPASSGICIAALFNSEEIGNSTASGADGDMLEAILCRICASLGINGDAYYSAVSRSMLLSVDVAHAVHPNHPEKSDPTNRPKLGGGVVLKYNANGNYVTDSVSASVIKSIFGKADVAHQSFHSRSDIPCGSTLGRSFVCRLGMSACDIGLPQLAMHSSLETFAKDDLFALYGGIKAFFGAELSISDNEIGF